MEKIACPACDNEEITCIYKRIYGFKKLLKCERCGLSFVWPKPLFSGKGFTEEDYRAWALHDLGSEGLSRMKRATFRRVLDIVEKYKSNGSLLDVGCAFGYLLEVAEKDGWDSRGVEFSEYAAKEARGKIGIDKVMVGDFMDFPLPANRFDSIVMADIIEHLYNINAVFKKCKELLKDEGILVIVTPDTDSLSRRCLRKHWPHFNEQHVTYFSNRGVKTVLGINGFRLLEKANFKKALNFYYIRGSVHAHCRKLLIALINIISILIPPVLKKMNFFMPHGEMIIIAQKK